MLPQLQPPLLVRLHRARRAQATLHPLVLLVQGQGLTAAQPGGLTSLLTLVHQLAQRPLPSLLALMVVMLAQV